MQTELRDPQSLKPHPRNSRRHSDDQIAALGRAMQEFGFHQPVVVNEHGTILVGHARTQAAIDIGLGQIPVVVVSGMPEAKQRALIIADNRLHEFGAGWDQDLLSEELRGLMGKGFDLSLTGFELDEIWTPEAREVDEDAAPPPADTSVSRLGDVWNLDGSIVVCGDATDAKAVGELLAYAKPDLMVTDPPYGVEYDPGWRNEVMRANGTIVTARATGKVLNDDNADWAAVWAMFQGSAVYVWHGGLHADVVAAGLEAAGLEIREQIIWDKGRMVIGRGNYHWRHEPCWYATRGKPRWLGGGHQSTVWEIAHLKSPTGHGTQKPVEAMRRPMLNHTKPGEYAFDPFLGSGTTLIAAETCARKAAGLELNPVYVDVCVRRWQTFTGRHAYHWDTGQSFSDVAAERAA